jgi:hypothetical protein
MTGVRSCAGICLQRMGFTCMCVGIKVRGALVAAVGRKALHSGYLGADTEANVVDAVAGDISKVYDALQVRAQHSCG